MNWKTFDDLSVNSTNHVALSPVQFLERTARVFPDKTAVIDGIQAFSYKLFYERCRKCADAISKADIRTGDVVSVMAPNSSPMLELHFAVPMSGAVLNAINTRLDPESVLVILRHAETRILFIDAAFGDVIAVLRNARDLQIQIVKIGEEPKCDYESFVSTGRENVPLPKVSDENTPISLNYTSGTTGNPKGVVYSHRGATLNALGNVLSMRFVPESRYLWTLPMFHCNGWTHPWAVVAAGGTQICLRRVEASDIFRSIAQHGVTHMACAPVVLTMLINVLDKHRRSFDQNVIIATGGAAPPSSVIKSMEDMGFFINHLYGLTETYGPSMVCEIQPDWAELPLSERARLMARQGVPHTLVGEVSVRNPESQIEVPWDGKTIGEVMVQGNTVMKGYLKNKNATDAAFVGGWFHTGDLAVTHPDGYVEIKDRSKDIIITGGENVLSLEVEEVLYQHSAILEAAVVACPDAHWGETPVAFVLVKSASAMPSADDLKLFCKERMASFKVPTRFIFGPLPKTSTGKIQKNVLRERLLESWNKEGSS